jgi:Flp pilus assembly protein TadD
MARSIVFGIAVLLMLGPAVSANRAQDSLLQEMYGQGVHAYFAGKYDQAHELFSTAIDQGSQDPRCHYFRGLTYAKLGRPDEAEADYKRGAELEAGGAAVQIDVGQALQRV